MMLLHGVRKSSNLLLPKYILFNLNNILVMIFFYNNVIIN